MPYIINEKFKNLIPPISTEEYALLEESILKDGCRDPLVVWGETIMDGHNRFSICMKHNLPFSVFKMIFHSDEEVEDWIDKNQLGRRNLSPDQMSLLRGRRYNRAKANREDNLKQNSPNRQNDGSATAKILSKDHGVSPRTIERDGQFANAVEKLKVIDRQIEKKVIQNKSVPKRDIVKAATILDEKPMLAKKVLDGQIKMSDAIREIKREEIISNLENIKVKEVKTLQGVYDVIVIDPPWPMQKIERDERPNQSEFDYPTMSEEQLQGLKIPAADNCHVWVWTTQKFLPMAFRLVDYWGFKYACLFTWHKNGGFQVVGLPQFNCEFAIYCRKGSPQFIDTKSFFTCFNAPRHSHSEKPMEFYDVVKRVTAGRRLDMFSRRVIGGFEGWGLEA